MALRYKSFWWLSYVLIALVFTAALLVDRERIIGAQYRGSLSYWVTWYPWYAITRNYNLVYNNYTLFPINTNLLPVLSLPTSAFYYPLRLIFGSLLAYHLLLPLYLTLNGWLGFRFLQKQVKNRWLAWFGGLILAFNPVTFTLAARGEFPLLGIFMLILWLLLWEHFLEAPTLPRLIGIVISLYLVVLMSLQFWNLIMTLLLPYAIYRAMQQPRPRYFWDYLLIGSLLFLILCLFYPASSFIWSSYPMEHFTLERAWKTADTTFYFPLEVWQGKVRIENVGKQIFLLGGLFIGLIALFRVPWEATPTRRLWVLIAAINMLFFIQPKWGVLRLLAEILNVPHTTQYTQNAVYLSAVILAVSIMTLQSLQYYLSQTSRPQLVLGATGIFVALGILLSGWGGSLPTSALPSYDFYDQIASEPEDYVIVDFPIGMDHLADDNGDYAQFSFSELAGRTQAYVPMHRKRVVGGLTAYLYPDQLQPYLETPLLQALNFQPFAVDNIAAAQLIRQDVIGWRIGYVMLHLGAVPREFEDGIRGTLAWTGAFCQIGTEGEIEIWRSRWHPLGCPDYTIRLGMPESEKAIGSGWHFAETWATGMVRWAGNGEVSELNLWANQPTSDVILRLRVAPPAEIETQTIEIVVNNEIVDSIELAPDWGEYTVTIPRQLIREGGLLQVELHHSAMVNIDGRDLTAVYEFVRLEAE